MSVVLGLGAVVLLLGAHALFVAGEFSLVAAPREQVERMSRDGDRRARRVVAALRSLSFQLSGAQLGITITSLLVGLLVETTLAGALSPWVEARGIDSAAAAHAIAAGIVLTLATTTEMVLAELVPKSYAIARPLGSAQRFVGPLWWFSRALRPLIVFLNASANWIIRRFGVEPREELRSVRSLEELELLIRTSGEQGTLDHDEANLLRRTIRFGHRTVADALVPRVDILAVSYDTTVTDLFHLARRSGHSRFPVYGQNLDDILGIADVKDGLGVSAERRDATAVTAIARPPHITPPTKALDALLVEMREEGREFAVVIDEYGGTDGIVTLEDLLEEIVGEIDDEYDAAGVTEPPLAVAVGGGSWVLEGSLHLDEVAEATGFSISAGDYETIAGFVLERLGRIPDAGDIVDHDGWCLTVLRLDGRRIARLRLTQPDHGSAS